MPGKYADRVCWCGDVARSSSMEPGILCDDCDRESRALCLTIASEIRGCDQWLADILVRIVDGGAILVKGRAA